MLGALVANVEQFLQHELLTSGVQFSKHQIGEPTPLLVDRVGLEQVLINTIKNSLDALKDVETNQSKRIEITLEYHADHAVLKVLDNGSGLSYEPDWHLQSFQTTKDDGLGLGLAICREIVSQHKGSLTIANRDDGVSGCLVTVTVYELETS